MKIKLATVIACVITLATVVIISHFSHGYCWDPGYCGDPEACKGRFYIAGSGAIVWHNDLKSHTDDLLDKFEYKTGSGAAFSMGGIYDMQGGWDVRLELEYVYRQNKIKELIIDDIIIAAPVGGHNHDNAIMGNFIVDVDICCRFSIYYGIGIGVSMNEIQVTLPGIDEVSKDEVFAWQVLAGMAYRVYRHVEVTVGYRLFGTTKAERTNNFDFHSEHTPVTNNLEIGLRVPF